MYLMIHLLDEACFFAIIQNFTYNIDIQEPMIKVITTFQNTLKKNTPTVLFTIDDFKLNLLPKIQSNIVVNWFLKVH